LSVSSAALLGWPLPVLLAGLLVSLGAGIVRGFAGFGYSALTIAGLSVFVAPTTAVPAVMALEVLASASLWRSAIKSADQAWLRALLAGNLVFVPIGIALLAYMPQMLLRLLVGLALFVTAIGLLLASGRQLAPTRGLRAVAGVASGLLNGVTASGGVAAAMLMAGAHLPAAALRATMVSFLFFAGIYVLLCAALLAGGGGTALLGVQTLRWAALLAPTMLAGVWIGRRLFTDGDPTRFRRHVLTLLIVISALGVLRAALDLMG
jgi:uncharacterized membrane protein YfcA